jgi:hypothetical protein
LLIYTQILINITENKVDMGNIKNCLATLTGAIWLASCSHNPYKEKIQEISQESYKLQTCPTKYFSLSINMRPVGLCCDYLDDFNEIQEDNKKNRKRLLEEGATLGFLKQHYDKFFKQMNFVLSPDLIHSGVKQVNLPIGYDSDGVRYSTKMCGFASTFDKTIEKIIKN